MNQSQPYSQVDHYHCPAKDSPCGLKGKHRCCLCGHDQSQPEMSEEEQFLYDNNPKYTPKQVRVMLAEARTAEQERVVGIFKEALEENRNETLWGDADSNEVMKESIDAFIIAVNDDVTEAIRGNERKV